MNYVNDKFQQSFEIVAEKFLSKIRFGEIIVTFPSGVTKSFKGTNGDEIADLKLHNYKFISKIIKRKSIGFAESYMDGDFSTSDLTKLLLISYKNEKYFLHNLKSNIFFNVYSKFKHFLNENTKKQSKKNIEYHYDLGNSFYDKWLDQSMTYSSAYFEKDNQNLFDAQINKYKQIADSLNLNENSKVLEIGCGWGGFADRLAQRTKAKLTATTISDRQFEYAQNRIQKNGFEDRISIIKKDYRDLVGQFDRIVSIEMIEAVGHEFLPSYFSQISDLLLPNGAAMIQGITMPDHRYTQYLKEVDYIRTRVFPGSCVPSASAMIAAAVKDSDLRPADLHDLSLIHI